MRRPHFVRFDQPQSVTSPDHQRARSDPSKKSPRNQVCIWGKRESQLGLHDNYGSKPIAVQFDLFGERFFDDAPLLVSEYLLIRSAISPVFRFGRDAKIAVKRNS
jgi:hypothetical protein